MPWGLPPDDAAHLVVPLLLVPPLMSTAQEPCHRGRSGSPAACLPSQMGSGDAIRSSAHDWGRPQQKGITSGFPIFLRLGLKCPEITLCERYLRDTPTFPPTNFFDHPGSRRIHLDHLPAKNPDTAKSLDESDPLKTLEKRRGCPSSSVVIGRYKTLSRVLVQEIPQHYHQQQFSSVNSTEAGNPLVRLGLWILKYPNTWNPSTDNSPDIPNQVRHMCLYNKCYGRSKARSRQLGHQRRSLGNPHPQSATCVDRKQGRIIIVPPSNRRTMFHEKNQGSPLTSLMNWDQDARHR